MTNTWASPSPSLDPLATQSSSPSALLVGWNIVLTLPYRLWDAYVSYLWHYPSNSWVGRVASTFRILAVILVLPVVLLTLLDVTSYVIARTLGVADDIKAFTSDTDMHSNSNNNTTAADQGRPASTVAVAVPASERVPVCSSDGPVRGSEVLAAEDSELDSGEARTDGDDHAYAYDSGAAVLRPASSASASGVAAQVQVREHMAQMVLAQTEMRNRQGEGEGARASDADGEGLSPPPRAYYFAGEDDLRLAGVGMFSPAASGPPSPLSPKMLLHTFAEGEGGGSGQASEDEGVGLRRRVQGAREDELAQA